MVSEVEAPHASLELEGHVRGQVEADEIPADVERFLPVRSTLIALTSVFVCVAALFNCDGKIGTFCPVCDGRMYKNTSHPTLPHETRFDVERFLPVRSTLIVLTAVFVCVAALSKDKHRLPCQPGVRDRGFFSEHGVTARRILE